MKLVDVLRDDNQRRRFIFAVPRPLRERMIEEHGSDKAVIACNSCVQVAWEWVTGAIPWHKP